LRAAATARVHVVKVGLRPGHYNRPIDSRGRARQNPEAMILEFLIALVKAGLPVGATAFLLTWWALRNGYRDDVEGLRDVERQVKASAKDKARKKQADLLHRKWLTLGGGFYGVVAVLTWLVIEAGDLADLFGSLGGLAAFFDHLSVRMLVGLVIEAIKNSFFALAWPVYWMQDFRGEHLWAWFVAAYAGYWAGSSLAIRQYRAKLGEPDGDEAG